MYAVIHLMNVVMAYRTYVVLRRTSVPMVSNTPSAQRDLSGVELFCSTEAALRARWPSTNPVALWCTKKINE